MNLHFDSIEDLTDFLDFAGYARANNQTMSHIPNAQAPSIDPTPNNTIEGPGAITGRNDPNDTSPEAAAANLAQMPSTAEPVKQKRTRKAAAPQTAADAAWPFPTPAEPSEPTVVASPLPDVAAAAAAAADAPAPAIDHAITGWITKRAADLGDIDPAVHLTNSRNFIAKHQLPQYFHTQQLAGVGDNAIQYGPRERALHTAAMEYFEAIQLSKQPQASQ